MSNMISTELRPQAPQAPPDGNAIASLVLGILGITVIPFICSILAVILGRASIGDAHKRGEPGSGMAKAGVVLGWIGVAVPAVLFVFLMLAVAPHHLWVVIPAVFVILVLSALVIYTRRKNRK
jgi:Domain of unknown function (DUF4190)